MNNKKLFSPAMFIVIILCFFLPFINISCGGQSIAKLSGYELAFGTSVNENIGFGNTNTRTVDAEPLATLSLIAAAGGLAFCFVNTKRKNIILVIISAAGTLLMIILAIKISNDASKQPGVTMGFEVGYYLSLIFFIASTGLSFINHKKEATKLDIRHEDSIYCTKCGAENKKGDKFCVKCGTVII